MSFIDDYQKKKEESEENTRHVNKQINLLASKLLDQAFKDYESGKLQARDITDLEKLNRIFNDTVERDKEIGDENGTLPALDSGQEHVIENTVKVTTSTKTDSQGNVIQEKKINLNDLGNLS